MTDELRAKLAALEAEQEAHQQAAQSKAAEMQSQLQNFVNQTNVAIQQRAGKIAMLRELIADGEEE